MDEMITIQLGSRQEVFDKVKDHLLEQYAVSKTSNGDGDTYCRYRGDEGRACAVGCLVPDDVYDEERFEQNTVYSLRDQARVEFLITDADPHDRYGFAPDAVLDFLSGLQNIHDQRRPNWWRMGLEDFAKEHELECEWSDE